MKKRIAILLFLFCNVFQCFSCGFEPWGETVRFSFLYPEYFKKDYQTFRYFYYNDSKLLEFDYKISNYFEQNIQEWYNYTRKKIPLESIKDFMNTVTYTDIHKNNQNAFLQYLYAHKLNNEIEYFKIAKKCEEISGERILENWERNDLSVQDNHKLLNEIENKLEKTKNPYFKRKYAFLIIKTAFYLKNNIQKSLTFDKYFKNTKTDYLYYWALSFNLDKTSDRYYNDLANLLANCPEKRQFAYSYESHFNLAKALKYAQSKEEKSNAYAFYSIQKLNSNFTSLSRMYELDPNSNILDFLLLREVNKIEDWVYTPYYTNYNSHFSFENTTTTELRNRSEYDRKYAVELYQFLNAVNLDSVKNKKLWLASTIQMAFISRKYEEAILKIKNFHNEYPNDSLHNLMDEIEALCQTCLQPNSNTAILPNVISTILKNKEDSKFIFAVGRELEFKGNLPDAIAVLSNINLENNYGCWPSSEYLREEIKKVVNWQANRLKNSTNLVYFYDYFDYIDFAYSANEVKYLINHLENHTFTDLEKKLYTPIFKNRIDFIDLLGTKYLRENQLEKSLFTFKKIPEEVWENSYNCWERNDEVSATFYDNPFYDFKGTDEFITKREVYIVTKLAVIEHILKYKNLAENPTTKDRPYYYFLLANVYANMTSKGNSWQMRRNFSSYQNYYDKDFESFIDEHEYRKSIIAQKYYDLAAKFSSSKKFKALCFRMREFTKHQNSNYEESFDLFKKTYPEYYEDLSGCDHLTEYFNSR